MGEEIKRILPDACVARYRELGWKAIQDQFYEERDGQHCGCGLGVMTGSKIVPSPGYRASSYSDALGLDYNYVRGFVHGFDGGPFYGVRRNHEFDTGHEDGRACWEAVQREGLAYG